MAIGKITRRSVTLSIKLANFLMLPTIKATSKYDILSLFAYGIGHFMLYCFQTSFFRRAEQHGHHFAFIFIILSTEKCLLSLLFAFHCSILALCKLTEKSDKAEKRNDLFIS
jgi:hypothetical protein